MTTTLVSLPTTIPQVLDILSNESALTTSQRTYLTHLVRTGVVSQAADAAGVSNECVRQWRCPSEQWYEMFRACETAVREGRREYSLAMARQELEHSAALTAHRMVETATAPDDGPRTMPTRQRARETILEAVGVIQRAPTVLVQQNNQAMDPGSVRALIERLEREREALMEQKRLHHGALSSQSALSPGVPDTKDEHNEAT